jgi:hypothetical protein
MSGNEFEGISVCWSHDLPIALLVNCRLGGELPPHHAPQRLIGVRRLIHRCSAGLLFKLSTLVRLGGDDGNRTHDPLLAKQVLCQLSYVPKGEENDTAAQARSTA